jgi:glutathione synthase/RimK-type ligase-like ATP-grasp enzyme
VATLDEALVVRAQWSSWLAALDDDRTLWINPLWAARRAENKIVQLTAARTTELHVPSTLVTNNRDTAVDFASAQRCGAVVKTLAPGYFAFSDQSFMFTTDISRAALAEPEEWRSQPVIVQQRLDRVRDVRVFVVRNEVAAAATRSAGSDWRLRPDETDWHIYPLPAAVAAACIKLTQSLGLVFAAIDMVDDGNQLWFLEANQAGEFQFVDRPLNLGVADSLARALAGSL